MDKKIKIVFPNSLLHLQSMYTQNVNLCDYNNCELIRADLHHKNLQQPLLYSIDEPKDKYQKLLG